MVVDDVLSCDMWLPDSQEDRVELLESFGFDCYPNEDDSISVVIGNLHIELGKHTLSLSDLFYSISKASINEDY